MRKFHGALAVLSAIVAFVSMNGFLVAMMSSDRNVQMTSTKTMDQGTLLAWCAGVFIFCLLIVLSYFMSLVWEQTRKGSDSKREQSNQ